jgi:S-phase kinase-associated protein 1
MAKTLVSNDNQNFKLSKEQVALSKYLSNQKDAEVKLEFNSAVLGKVQEYLNKYDKLSSQSIPAVLDGKSLVEDVGPESAKFIEDINDWEVIFNLINCALILELPHLHDLACARVATFMKQKSPDEVQKEFTIECQLTSDEAKELGLEPEANS